MESRLYQSNPGWPSIMVCVQGDERTFMIRDLLLSITLYGAIALCLAVLTQFNPWLYGKIRQWLI
jgi:hypothetical protein